MGKINIVMTGGTSGIGEITAKKLITEPETRVILGYRNKQVQGAVHISLDLRNFDSVRSFAAEVVERTDSEKIHILICNAGVNFPNVNTRTVNGFETTFAVNHLAHYLLIRLLMPHLAENAKIILTTSGTHDPAEKSAAAPPIHANAYWLANPEKDPTLDDKESINSGRAYSSSKLCNILTARYLDTTPEAKSGNWQTIAYDPGPTPGTGFAQNRGIGLKLLWQLLAIPALRKRMFPKSSGRQKAGRTLAEIALGNIRLPTGKIYAALRKGTLTFPNPSELAQNDEAMINLWKDSEQLLGLDK